jgi:uncharacterized membrane protein YtjA (UPF0391 family)
LLFVLPTHLVEEGIDMFSWAIAFLIIAFIAAILGFGGIAGTSAGIAKILFFVALALLVVSLLAGGLRGRGAPRV